MASTLRYSTIESSQPYKYQGIRLRTGDPEINGVDQSQVSYRMHREMREGRSFSCRGNTFLGCRKAANSALQTDIGRVVYFLDTALAVTERLTRAIGIHNRRLASLAYQKTMGE